MLHRLFSRVVSTSNSFRSGVRAALVLGLFGLGLIAQPAQAAIVSNVSVDTTTDVFFSAANNDLIDNSQLLIK